MYKDISLGFWTDALGRKALTKEVVKMFTDNGFPFYATLRGGAQAFYNKDKKMAYVIRTVKDSETKEEVFEMQLILTCLENVRFGLTVMSFRQTEEREQLLFPALLLQWQ